MENIDYDRITMEIQMIPSIFGLRGRVIEDKRRRNPGIAVWDDNFNLPSSA